jgi:hypothetical protein
MFLPKFLTPKRKKCKKKKRKKEKKDELTKVSSGGW